MFQNIKHMSADPQRCVQGWLMAVSFLISAYGSLIIPSVGTLQSQGGNMSVPRWEHVSPSVGLFLPLLAAYCSNKWRLLKDKERLLRNKRRLLQDLTCFSGKVPV